MAITPDEAKNSLIESQRKAVERLESKCETALKKEWDGTNRVFVGVGESEYARREVQRRFQAAGWKVLFHSDQRDGETLEFTTEEVHRQYMDSLK